MAFQPEIQFARNGEISIGFVVIGDGPIDLVYVPPVSSLEILWENPLYDAFLRRMASFARLVVVDRRGAGVSDRYSPDDLPPLEDLADDLVAVLDAAGSERAVLFGPTQTPARGAPLAATYPERLSGLVLYAVAARGTQGG